MCLECSSHDAVVELVRRVTDSSAGRARDPLGRSHFLYHVASSELSMTSSRQRGRRRLDPAERDRRDRGAARDVEARRRRWWRDETTSELLVRELSGEISTSPSRHHRSLAHNIRHIAMTSARLKHPSVTSPWRHVTSPCHQLSLTCHLQHYISLRMWRLIMTDCPN